MTTILITGANRGLGLAMVEAYAERGGVSIIACCRTPDRAEALQALLEAKGNIRVEALDVSDIGSIERLGESLRGVAIDILINNAGIYGKNPPATTGFQDQVFGNSDFEADWIAPFKVNVIGPMKIVETLVENVAASKDKKVVIITSVIGSVTTAPGQMFGYAASKAAANMTAKNLSVALRSRNIIVNSVHPGYAKTDMGGEGAHVEVKDAIAGVIKQIDGMSLAKTGCFLSYDGGELPW